MPTSLRHEAVKRDTGEASRKVRQLERLTRDQPDVSAELGKARQSLRRAHVLAAGEADCTLTAADPDHLRIRSAAEPAALSELARREELPVAA